MSDLSDAKKLFEQSSEKLLVLFSESFDKCRALGMSFSETYCVLRQLGDVWKDELDVLQKQVEAEKEYAKQRALEQEAIALYAVAARDICDFFDMILVTRTDALKLLLQTLQHPPSKDTDARLNQICEQLVIKQLQRRGELPSD